MATFLASLARAVLFFYVALLIIPASAQAQTPASNAEVQVLEGKIRALEEKVQIQQRELELRGSIARAALKTESGLEIKRLEERINIYLAVVVGLVGVFTFLVGFFGRQAIVGWVERKTQDFVQQEATTKVSRYVEKELQTQSNAALQSYMNKFEEKADADFDTYLKKFEAELEKAATARKKSEANAEKLQTIIDNYSPGRPFTPEQKKVVAEASKAIAETKSTEEYTAQEWFVQGLNAAENGDYQKANEAWTKTIDLDPNYISAHYNRGLTYLSLNRYDDAIADFNKAIDLDLNYALAYYNRGLTYHELKRYDDALADYDKAINLKPDFATAYNNRGNTYHELKRYDDAIADYDKTIDLDPNNATAYNNRGLIYRELKRYDDAIADSDKAIDLNPNNALAYYSRGLTYHELKRYDDAIADYNKAIDLDPNDATAYNNRGSTYLSLKRYDDALADYNKAIDLDPNDATAHNNRGSTYHSLKRYDDAIADYNKAIDLDPNYTTPHLNLAEIYLITHQPGEALTQAEHTLSITDEIGSHIFGLYFKSIALSVLQKDTSTVVTQLSSLLAQAPEIMWSSDEIRIWLKEATLAPETQRFIEEITAMMEAHQ